MRTLFSLVLTIFLWAAGWAQKTYLGLFMGGARIGYSVSEEISDTAHGAAKRTDSKTVMGAGLLGTNVNVEIRSVTWSTEAGKPLRMEYQVESAGRTQKMVATFGDSIQLNIDNNGQTSSKQLALPKDGKVVDDAVSALLGEGVAEGGKRIYYVLDPMTAALVRNEAQLVGKTQVQVKGQTFGATEVRVVEARSTMRVFLSAKGDLIKIDGPMGIEMRPLSEAEATAPFDERPASADLAFGTAIQPDKPLGDPRTIRRLRLRIRGGDLSRLPSDEFQSVKKEGDAWIVELHPFEIQRDTTIAESARQKEAFTKPSLNVPADDPELQALAQKVFAGATTVAEAAEKTRRHVFALMRPNAGIGVLRDAREVLKTREGVCRDYAILTAALLRAGGIPTKLVSGLVLQDGAWYYHAWVEVWDGARWFGVDPTRDENVGAGHLKLAAGNMEEAFTFTVLDGVKMEVLRVVRR